MFDSVILHSVWATQIVLHLLCIIHSKCSYCILSNHITVWLFDRIMSQSDCSRHYKALDVLMSCPGHSAEIYRRSVHHCVVCQQCPSNSQVHFWFPRQWSFTSWRYRSGSGSHLEVQHVSFGNQDSRKVK